MTESLHELTEKEAAFLIKFALRKVPAGVLKDIHAGTQEKRDRAAFIAVETILGHLKLSGHKLFRGPGLGNHGDGSPGWIGKG
jgi:hypothetical protein